MYTVLLDRKNTTTIDRPVGYKFVSKLKCVVLWKSPVKTFAPIRTQRRLNRKAIFKRRALLTLRTDERRNLSSQGEEEETLGEYNTWRVHFNRTKKKNYAHTTRTCILYNTWVGSLCICEITKRAIFKSSKKIWMGLGGRGVGCCVAFLWAILFANTTHPHGSLHPQRALEGWNTREYK